MKFAERIKELREEKGLNKLGLAKLLGVSHTAIMYWENGTKVPSVYSLMEIAKVFGVTLDYLVGLEN